MGIRPKLLLILTAIGIVLLLVLSFVNYRSGARALETEMLGELQREALVIGRDMAGRLREHEDALIALSRSPSLRAYVRGEMQPTDASTSSARPLSGQATPPRADNSPASAQPSADEEMPKEIQGEVRAFIQSGANYYVAVTCLNVRRQPLFRAELQSRERTVRFQTRDFLSASVQADDRVWSVADQAPLRSGVLHESFGSILRYTIPVFVGEETGAGERGALIVDLKLDTLLDEAAGTINDLWLSHSTDLPLPPHLVVILDRADTVLYHTNTAFKYQPAERALPPSFNSITNEMKEGRDGWQYYYSAEGHRWLAAYRPLAPLALSVAVAGDYSFAVLGLRWMSWVSVGLIVLLGGLMLLLLWLSLRRTARSIERVTEGAVAIAGGKLDERIEVRSSDETRLLAESFNAMTERLREQIAHEAETRQFESFMRLSAILTHDLKNSILALSLLVSNMKERFHREDFREDALLSLTEATDNLRALVARLSEPVRSLSGEFKRPRPVDLIPVIKRVTARIIEPANLPHEVEIALPSSLVAVADGERIERVFENLLLNALEAMGTEKGRLKVEAGVAEEGFVFFSVSDTGPGMTEEFQRTKLFRPFTTTKKKGVGLGLYTCRELVRALGGRVEVQSERGSGTTFRVVLPSGQIKESASFASNRAR